MRGWWGMSLYLQCQGNLWAGLLIPNSQPPSLFALVLKMLLHFLHSPWRLRQTIYGSMRVGLREKCNSSLTACSISWTFVRDCFYAGNSLSSPHIPGPGSTLILSHPFLATKKLSVSACCLVRLLLHLLLFSHSSPTAKADGRNTVRHNSNNLEKYIRRFLKIYVIPDTCPDSRVSKGQQPLTQQFILADAHTSFQILLAKCRQWSVFIEPPNTLVRYMHIIFAYENNPGTV